MRLWHIVVGLWLLVAVPLGTWAAMPVQPQEHADTDTLTLSDEVQGELAVIEARRLELIAAGMDRIVANIAANTIKSLAVSVDAYDLGSWSIHPVGEDRVVIHGRLLMSTLSGRRTYTFALVPEAAGN